MGNFYTNITLRGTDQRSVADILSSRGRPAIVSPTVNGLTVVYDAEGECQGGAIIELAEDLSKRLDCTALAVTNHHDDILFYQLFQSGRQIDQYISAPNYFSQKPPTGPAGGDVALLCEAFGNPDAAASVREILQFDKYADDEIERYVFEFERHEELVAAAGLSPFAVATGYNSFDADEIPEGLDPADCVVIGDATPPPEPAPQHPTTAEIADAEEDAMLIFTTVAKGDVSTLGSLLAQGMDPNWTDPNSGHSALSLACMTNNIPSIKTLLDAGADVNLRLTQRSVFDGTEQMEATAVLFARSAEAVELLFAAGADVNATNKSGLTPLIFAAGMGNSEVVAALLDAGADPEHTAANGLPALGVAMKRLEELKTEQFPAPSGDLEERVRAIEKVCELLGG